jgi:hypothetical protein
VEEEKEEEHREVDSEKEKKVGTNAETDEMCHRVLVSNTAHCRNTCNEYIISDLILLICIVK